MKIQKLFTWILLISAGVVLGTYYRQTQKPVPPVKHNEAPPRPRLTGSTSNLAPGDILHATEDAVIELFQQTAPSVCYITTSVIRNEYSFWGERNEYEIPSGTGSGFVWDKDGHIVTNFHVIKGADGARVTLADHTTWTAKLVGVAPEKDLAVLKIDAPAAKLHPIPVGSSEQLRVGQFVMAIGNPFGLDQTLTTGVISALDREIKGQNGVPIRGAIQTDAAINPGNSGGPLINARGELIGVNTAIYSPSGASAGIGFSIPVGEVAWVVPELIRNGKIIRPSLGFEIAESLSRRVKGAVINYVYKNSNAAKAGLKPAMMDAFGRIYLGDVVVAIDDKEVTNPEELKLALDDYKPGDRVTLTVIRNNREYKVDLTLEPPR